MTTLHNHDPKAAQKIGDKVGKAAVLVIDDERNTREGLQKYFRHKYNISLADSAEAGLSMLVGQPFDIVLVDLRMPGMDGISFIRQVSTMKHAPLVILFTAYGTVQIADAALKEGAYDYLTKPLNLDNLEMIIDRGLETRQLQAENQRLRSAVDQRNGLDAVIGNSRPMQRVLDTVRQVASARTTVLISGESGTGKEVIAQSLHRVSSRAKGPFVVVHCAALNQNLLESELFGHEKGAFTGAHERKIGRFEKADGGTIFLDEVGEIDPATQIKLLRVLETRIIERVGGSTPIEVDVRLIAATNRNLRQLVDQGQFREDLFYRLNVVNIDLPPLRERRDDIILLLGHFLQFFAQENGKHLDGFADEAMKVLTAYAWPGNVRELRNCVEHMVVMARGTTLTLGDVPAEIRGAVANASDTDQLPTGTVGSGTTSADTTLDITSHERELIKRALEECRGNRTRAAERLGISRRTLHRKLKIYGLEEF